MSRRIAWALDAAQIEWSAVRAQGAGGQNVNKVSNAAQLRFDVGASSLPEALKRRLLDWPDQRIGSDGVVVIKAQTHRSLPRNRNDALSRLRALIDAAALLPDERRPTRPGRGAIERRLQAKKRVGALKAARRDGGRD
ncbi:MAG: aminoacyl-tRNA hydrolase [Rubrivivax sp.]|jgi:ribosome-associated protein|nr:aminoacyl-tRNA hydrolase [Rubrivivax sp.]